MAFYDHVCEVYGVLHVPEPCCFGCSCGTYSKCPRCDSHSPDGELCEQCEEREAFYNEVNGDSLDPEGLRS